MKKLNLKEVNYSGRLIVFEGTDGAGKTSMINLLVKYLSIIIIYILINCMGIYMKSKEC